ncbi:glutathione S-transferase family protein [Xanthomonas citri]|uniref:glutathione S-transferase family protein n=1 Tax=Xanthomonas citri TaxID=346 RepID=UPI000C0803E8|nr:glutathione S-transferase family protein [Xanthomonas citri]
MADADAGPTVPILYGSLPSRTFRCLWMLEELGLAYEWVGASADDMKSDAYLALNPNGRMPVLRDGAVVVWESIAINLYLAMKDGGPLWPTALAQQASVLQWSLWAVSDIEPHVVAALADSTGRAAEHARRLATPLAVLDRALARSRFLLGPAFTAADVNVAGILSSVHATSIDLAAFPDVRRWLAQCIGRPWPSRFFTASPGAAASHPGMSHPSSG